MITMLDDQEIKSPGTRVFYFYANWTPFHRTMNRIILKAEEEFSIPFIAIDVDAFPNWVKANNITSIPELVLFKDSVEIGRANGLMLTSALRNLLREKYS